MLGYFGLENRRTDGVGATMQLFIKWGPLTPHLVDAGQHLKRLRSTSLLLTVTPGVRHRHCAHSVKKGGRGTGRADTVQSGYPAARGILTDCARCPEKGWKTQRVETRLGGGCGGQAGPGLDHL